MLFFEKLSVDWVEQFQIVVVGVDADFISVVHRDVTEIDFLNGVVNEDPAVGNSYQQILDQCNLHNLQIGVN